MEYYNPLLFQQLAPALHINDSKVKGSSVALQLRSSFNKYNISHSHWDNCIIKNRLLSSKYLIKLTDSWDFGAEKKTVVSGSQETHSVLSPFNPESDIYPNGIISENWFKKYIEDLPFAFVGVFNLGGDSEGDDLLVAELEQLKLKFATKGVKFVAILLSENLVEEQGVRMESISQQTGLQKLHGLFCLHSSADKNANLTRDVTVLVSTLLSNLKNPAIEFYSGVEAKIRQRNKKYYSYPEVSKIKTKVELTPVFLETRNLIKQGIMFQFSNPHNVEMSLKYLIPAYDNLIGVLRENFADYTDMLEHDVKLFNHFRSLIDALVFHIVRCYLAMEDSVTCLLKHKQHTTIIKEICSNSTNQGEISNWISVQYEWLAELLDLIPQSILPIVKKYNNSPLATVFFGGIQFQENGESYDIMTKSGLLYLKAAEYLKDSSVSVSSNIYSLLPHYENTEMISQKKISLFKMAKAFFMDVESNSSSSPTISNASHAKYIDWLIAEEYYKLTRYSTAIEYYLSGKDESLQLYRLLDCYAKLGDKSKFLETSIKISMQKSVSAFKFKFPTHFKIPLFDGTLDSLELFKVTPFITNKTLQERTYIYDECICQLEIKPIIDIRRLEELLGASKIKLNLNKIIIKFGTGFEDVNLDSGSGNLSFSLVEIDANKKGTFGFSEVDELKVIQFQQIAKKVGFIKIELIEIESCMIIDDHLIGHVGTYMYENVESILFHDVRFYLENSLKNSYNPSLSYRNIRLNGLPNYAVRIYPVKPQVKLVISSLPRSIVIGEKLKLPILIDIKEQKGVDLSKLSIVSNVKIEGGSDSEKFTIRTSWNELKDDEPLRPTVDTKLVYLNLSILSPPSMEVNGDSLLLEFKVILNDDDTPASVEEVDEYPTVFDIIKYELDVLKTPFSCKYGISPRYRNSPEENDMPNPFIIGRDTHISMPIATRVWNGKVSITNSIAAIEIIDTEISVKSQNPEVHLEEGELSKSDSLSSKVFSTTSKTGFSHRNVIVSSIAVVKWKRINSDIVNEFRSKEWEITLPLSDPRVLLKIEQEPEELVKLHYVIENPTPRIFTFTTQLVSDDWGLVEELNIVPSVQPAFPVLPFLRHVMDFYGKYNGQDNTVENIKLPQLRVYDVNYKVGLPILSVVDEVITSEGILYWKKN